MKDGFWWGSIAALLLAACTFNQSAGNTMETENSVAFQIRLPNGQAAAYVHYSVRSASFLSDTVDANTSDSSNALRSGTTNKSGWVHIENLSLGSYVIEFSNEELGGALTYDHLDTTGPEPQYNLVLDTVGSVRGRINLPEGVDVAWVQIFGMDVVVMTDSLGNFQIDNLPVGTLRLTAWSPLVATLLAEVDFTVLSGDTLGLGLLSTPVVVSENPTTWLYSRSLQASDLISDWMRPLQIPSVLTLRLNADNFDFSEALDDGHDLRLWSTAGKSLPLQRVRWDASAGLAVIRIRLEDASDTLGNWTLTWGKPRALDPGYVDVWSGISDSLFVALNSILIDDFERGSNHNALPDPIAVGYWFMVADSASTITPRKSFVEALQDDVERHSTVASFTYETPTPGGWVMLGTTLGDGPHSLAILDSIEFWYRGDGLYFVALENNSNSVGRKAWMHESADSLWTRTVVKPSDFTKGDSIGGNVGWDAVRDSVTNLSFFAGQGSYFLIDDIRLYGINQDDLYP